MVFENYNKNSFKVHAILAKLGHHATQKINP